MQQILGIKKRIGCYKQAPLVAIMGVDGSGKTTIINMVKGQFKHRLAKRVHVLYRNKKIFNTKGPIKHHKMPPYSTFVSVGKLFYKAIFWVFHYYTYLAPLRKKGTIILCDHFYFFYFAIDPIRFRYGGPNKLAWVVAKLVPKPDINILLDASFEVVYQRKQEISPDAMHALIQAHHELLSKLPNAYVVNANLPLTKVVREVSEIINNKMNE